MPYIKDVYCREQALCKDGDMTVSLIDTEKYRHLFSSHEFACVCFTFYL